MLDDFKSAGTEFLKHRKLFDETFIPGATVVLESIASIRFIGPKESGELQFSLAGNDYAFRHVCNFIPWKPGARSVIECCHRESGDNSGMKVLNRLAMDGLGNVGLIDDAAVAHAITDPEKLVLYLLSGQLDVEN
jgi:hypothetical protein